MRSDPPRGPPAFSSYNRPEKGARVPVVRCHHSRVVSVRSAWHELELACCPPSVPLHLPRRATGGMGRGVATSFFPSCLLGQGEVGRQGREWRGQVGLGRKKPVKCIKRTEEKRRGRVVHALFS